MNIQETYKVIVYSMTENMVLDSFYYGDTPPFKRGEYYTLNEEVFKIEKVTVVNDVDYNKRTNTRTYQLNVIPVPDYQLDNSITPALDW